MDLLFLDAVIHNIPYVASGRNGVEVNKPVEEGHAKGVAHWVALILTYLVSYNVDRFVQGRKMTYGLVTR